MSEDTALERKIVFSQVKFIMDKKKILSERERLELVKKGNREAYQGVVQQYMKTAYYIALGFVHNHQDALDLSQESFVKAFRKIKSFDTRKPFFPWFYKLMKNLCLDYLRKRRRFKEIPLEEVQVFKEEKEDRDLREVLWRGIQKLSFEQREVIILHYFQQHSYQEIAEIIDKPIGTVMSSLHYAKKRLKEIIGKFLGLE